MTQEDKPWQTRWDENGWKPKNGLSPYYMPKEYTEEEFDAILKEAVPKEDLTEEEFNEAKRIWESERNMLKVVKYLQSVEYGESSKLAKGYFDLYIDDRNYDKV